MSDVDGTALTVDLFPGEDAETLKVWLAPVIEATGAEILVTDDGDGPDQVADADGLDDQVCKSHVERNTEALAKALQGKLRGSEDSSLMEIRVSAKQAEEDLSGCRNW